MKSKHSITYYFTFFETLKVMFALCVFIIFSANTYTVKASGLKYDNKLVFGIFDTPPYVIKENGETTGLFIEIVNILKEETDLVGGYRIAPLTRLRKERRRRGFDCTILADLPSVRKRFALFFPLGISLNVGIVTQKYIKINTHSDLAGLNVALVNSTKVNNEFDEDPLINKVFVNNYFSVIHLLKLGKVQAAAGALPSLFYNIDKHSEFDRDMVSPGFIMSKAGLGIACLETILQTKMSNIIGLQKKVFDLTEKGVFKALEVKYFK